MVRKERKELAGWDDGNPTFVSSTASSMPSVTHFRHEAGHIVLRQPELTNTAAQFHHKMIHLLTGQPLSQAPLILHAQLMNQRLYLTRIKFHFNLWHRRFLSWGRIA